MAKALERRIAQLEKLIFDFFTGGAKPAKGARKPARRKANKAKKRAKRKSARKSLRP